MSEVIGEGVVRIRTDESGVNPEASGKAVGAGYSKGFLSSVKGVVAAAGVAIAAKKAFDFTKDAVAAARESQKISLATEQIIKSTGFAAGVSAEHVSNFAGSLAAATGIDDELIQSGQNLILTFKNVANAGEGANAIFDRTTKAAVDLSAAGFGSVTSASLQLGKALNDPIKGVSALARSGVTFTQAQKDQIKALVESGDLLSAQKIILKEVEGQVGGVAKATASSGDRMRVAFGNVQEAIGGLLLPALDRVNNFLADTVAPAILTLVDNADRLKPVFTGIAGAVTGLFGSGGAQGALTGFTGVVREIVGTLLPVMQRTFMTKILPALISVGSYVQQNLFPVFRDVASLITDEVVPTVLSIAVLIYGTLYPAIIDVVTAVGKNLKPVFDQMVATFKADVLPTIQQTVVMIRTQLVPALQPVIEKVLAVVGAVLKLVAAILAKVLPVLIKWYGFLFRNIVPALVQTITVTAKVVDKILDFGRSVGSAIADLVRFQARLVGVVRQGLDPVLDVVTFLPKRMLALGGRFFDAGKEIIGQFIKGLTRVGGIATSLAGTVWTAVKGYLNHSIDQINSYLEFTIKGPGPLPDVKVNPPNIPHLARGTSNWRGGVTWVGEEGPELVNLPRGSQVFPADQSADMAGSGNIIIGTLMPHDYGEFVRQMRETKRAASIGGRRGPA